MRAPVLDETPFYRDPFDTAIRRIHDISQLDVLSLSREGDCEVLSPLPLGREGASLTGRRHQCGIATDSELKDAAKWFD
jgi:hypothetical protein